MEAVYLYLAFSYLFALGVTHEFDAPWWVELMLFAFSPLLMPIIVGMFHGSMAYYKGNKEE